ncbi:MAG: protein YgfX [Gammaproteobacteria bacterium]
MDNAFEGAIALTVGRSRLLVASMLAGHALTVLMVVMLDLGAGSTLLLAAGVALSALVGYRHQRDCRDDDVIAVLLKSDDRWQLQLRDGRLEMADLKVAFPLTPGLVYLSFRTSAGVNRAAALFSDNTEADQLRRLRVRLRHFRRERK